MKLASAQSNCSTGSRARRAGLLNFRIFCFFLAVVGRDRPGDLARDIASVGKIITQASAPNSRHEKTDATISMR
jgi:hypothetical protein